MISPLFTTIVLVSAFIWIYMKITVKHVGKGTEEFIEREVKANNVRKQSIEHLEYIHIDEQSIPFINPAPNDRIASLYDTIRDLFPKKIVNLTGLTNTDLKMAYGPANLPALTEYDQNFTALARAVYDLGTELIAAKYIAEATRVLEYGISIGTDISGNYIALANIYVENSQYDNITRLIENAKNIRSMTSGITVNKLQEILDTHTTMVIAHSVDLPEVQKDAPAQSVPETISLKTSSDSDDSILPSDILDILDFVNDISNDQTP